MTLIVPQATDTLVVEPLMEMRTLRAFLGSRMTVTVISTQPLESTTRLLTATPPM
jgi:hypothetical protein